MDSTLSLAGTVPKILCCGSVATSRWVSHGLTWRNSYSSVLLDCSECCQTLEDISTTNAPSNSPGQVLPIRRHREHSGAVSSHLLLSALELPCLLARGELYKCLVYLHSTLATVPTTPTPATMMFQSYVCFKNAMEEWESSRHCID